VILTYEGCTIVNNQISNKYISYGHIGIWIKIKYSEVHLFALDNNTMKVFSWVNSIKKDFEKLKSTMILCKITCFPMFYKKNKV